MQEIPGGDSINSPLHTQQYGIFFLLGITLPHFAVRKLNGEFLFTVRVCLGSFVRGFCGCFSQFQNISPLFCCGLLCAAMSI